MDLRFKQTLIPNIKPVPAIDILRESFLSVLKKTEPDYEVISGIHMQNARFVIPFYLTGNDTLRFRVKGSSGNWIGSYNDASATDNFSFYGTTSSTGKYARYNGQTGGSAIATGTWYDIVISPEGVTGSRNPSSFTSAEFTCSIPLCVGATSPTGTSGPNVSFEGDIVVDNRLTLSPRKRLEDGVVGLYDGTTFYTPILDDDGSVTPLE